MSAWWLQARQKNKGGARRWWWGGGVEAAALPRFSSMCQGTMCAKQLRRVVAQARLAALGDGELGGFELGSRELGDRELAAAVNFTPRSRRCSSRRQRERRGRHCWCAARRRAHAPGSPAVAVCIGVCVFARCGRHCWCAARRHAHAPGSPTNMLFGVRVCLTE